MLLQYGIIHAYVICQTISPWGTEVWSILTIISEQESKGMKT